MAVKRYDEVQIFIAGLLFMMVITLVIALTREKGNTNKSERAAYKFLAPLGKVKTISCDSNNKACAAEEHASCAAEMVNGTIYLMACSNYKCSVTQVSIPGGSLRAEE